MSPQHGATSVLNPHEYTETVGRDVLLRQYTLNARDERGHEDSNRTGLRSITMILNGLKRHPIATAVALSMIFGGGGFGFGWGARTWSGASKEPSCHSRIVSTVPVPFSTSHFTHQTSASADGDPPEIPQITDFPVSKNASQVSDPLSTTPSKPPSTNLMPTTLMTTSVGTA